MALKPVQCVSERVGFGGDGGHIFVPCFGGEALSPFVGKVQTAIVDKPMAAKSTFQWKAGADDWLTNRNSLRITIHNNRSDGMEEYLSLLQKDLHAAKELLCETGMVYVFADQRASAHVRLLLDDVFGRTNFLNEIIWAQEAGLRPAGRFTRSHETIFLYRKGSKALFNAGAAGRARGRMKSHMRRAEEGGRAYYARESGGKVYRYFEDEIVSIGDVWTDIPEIGARDDERTGWEGQRPEALISRMIAASSAPGDIVCDVMSAGGTTASAAQKLGRRVLLAGLRPPERMLARRRLLLAGAQCCTFIGIEDQPDGQPEVTASVKGNAIELGIYHRADSLLDQPGTLLDDGLGALEYWAAGRYTNGVFQAGSWALRTRQAPTLPQTLSIGDGDGQPCIHLVDACGEQWFYLVE